MKEILQTIFCIQNKQREKWRKRKKKSELKKRKWKLKF